MFHDHRPQEVQVCAISYVKGRRATSCGPSLADMIAHAPYESSNYFHSWPYRLFQIQHSCLNSTCTSNGWHSCVHTYTVYYCVCYNSSDAYMHRGFVHRCIDGSVQARHPLHHVILTYHMSVVQQPSLLKE